MLRVVGNAELDEQEARDTAMRLEAGTTTPPPADLSALVHNVVRRLGRHEPRAVFGGDLARVLGQVPPDRGRLRQARALVAQKGRYTVFPVLVSVAAVVRTVVMRRR